MLLLREDDVEDSVGAAASLIHVGRSHRAEKKEKDPPLLFFVLAVVVPFDAFESRLTGLCSQSPSGPGCRCMT